MAYEIRPVDRSCKSYFPGRQLHWMQANKSINEEQPGIDVSIIFAGHGRVDLEGDDGLSVALWNHHAARLRNAWEDGKTRDELYGCSAFTFG